MLLVELLLVERGVGGEEGRRGERRLGNLGLTVRLLLRHHREARHLRRGSILGARLPGRLRDLELSN